MTGPARDVTQTIFLFKSYRDFLKTVLEERTSRNPSYSMRSLARRLALAPSALFAILRGTKGLSASRAYDVAERLGLKGSSREYFSLLVQLEAAASDSLRESVRKRLSALAETIVPEEIPVERFSFIADWYCIPIIEMTYLDGFEFTPRNIAARLGIPVGDAKRAVERLLRLVILVREGDGKFRKNLDAFLVTGSLFHPAMNAHNRKMLELGIEKLDSAREGYSHLKTTTLTIDTRHVPEIIRLYDELMGRLIALCKSGEKKTATYQLNFQLFDLTGGLTRGPSPGTPAARSGNP